MSVINKKSYNKKILTAGSVVSGGHTNTERGYLPILAKKLRTELDQGSCEVREGLAVGGVLVSVKDAHPLRVV